MVNNSFHPHVWYVGSQDIFRNNIVFEAYKPIRVPEPWGSACDFNLLHKPGEQSALPAEILQRQSGRDDHSIIADAAFIDPVSGDYRIDEDSPAHRIGFKNFPMDQFGVTKESFRQIARKPDLPNSSITIESVRDPQIQEWCGVQIKNVTCLGEVSAFGLPGETGVWIVSISEDCGLAQAGLKEADVILEYAEKKINDINDLSKLHYVAYSDNPIPITVFRNQREHSFEYVPSSK